MLPTKTPTLSGMETISNQESNRDGQGITSSKEQDGADSKPLKYGDILRLKTLLTIQNPLSPVHDEHLFIVAHQAFELWFKQIIFDLNAILKLMNTECNEESNLLFICSKLSRIVTILELINGQFEIIETITPSEYHAFKNHFDSGFGLQSFQFRLIENLLGVKNVNRIQCMGMNYKNVFTEKERDKLEQSEKAPTLFQLVDHWLSCTPGLETHGFNFWYKFDKAVNAYLNSVRDQAMKQVNPVAKEASLKRYKKETDTFESILRPDRHEELMRTDNRRLSHRAMQGALMISYYRDKPQFSIRYQILTLLMDIETRLGHWRHNHSLIAHRMIGSKAGSSDSRGHRYLISTMSQRYGVFSDLVNLATFYIPSNFMPPLTCSFAISN